MRSKMRYLVLLLLLLALLAGCGELPFAPAGQEATAAPPTVPTEPPTETPRPTETPQPTETPTPPADAPPTPPIQPTPYAPAEALPEGFPTIVYAVQRSGQPVQIWSLHYKDKLLNESLSVDLRPDVLEEKIHPFEADIGYWFVDHVFLSPDAQSVAVNLQNGEGGVRVLIVGANGDMHLPLIPELGQSQLLAWVPGGEKLVVASSFWVVWGTITIDGKDFTPFPISDVLEALVLEDGEKVIFSMHGPAGSTLGSIDLKGGNWIPFSMPDPLPGILARNLALSPDGSTCAFTWDRRVSDWGAGQIWIMDADGTAQRPLSPADTEDFDLAWSPDGRTIAFVRWENPEDRVLRYNPSALVSSLWLVDVDGGQERLLLSSEGQFAHWSPRWLPDGSGLVFLSDRGGEGDLWFVRPDGSGLQQLTRQGGVTGSIAVSGK